MRPEKRDITFIIDGREVTAPEGEILVDAAKRGDVEIPVFCYEPKLGNPVGACRMCLVEIEGLPKLQAGCATPVRDGMVVYSRSPKAVEAQNSTVEFLLANHPLDCPVCDKGGECPLQDISMGWGPGRSRFTEPKRHFQKPLPLSPLIAIDRERCILCYRCVRFSQDVTEDEQLQLIGRGADTYVGTFDDRPYVAPFHGNITELCPVGALTSRTYRFRARPWDIEDAGTVCTLCPAQCNVKLTVRDEEVMRVLARDNQAIDDGWLCDKGRYGFQMAGAEERITAPMVRQGGILREASWDEALGIAAERLGAAREKTAAVAGGGTSNEEGWLVQRILRGTLGSPNVDSRAGGPVERDLLAGLARPELGAAVADIDHAGAILVLGCDPLNDAPVIDLRIRKAVRHGGAKLFVATERPSALDGGAQAVIRYAPGDAASVIRGLAGPGGDGDTDDMRTGLGDAEDVVVIWGESLSHAGGDGAAALLELAESLGLADQPEGGLLEIPDTANARGLREAGCLPTAGPGLAETPRGLAADELPDAILRDDITAVVLANANPVRDHHGTRHWGEALTHADFVLSIAAFEDESTAHADVVLPAETYAEKDGTVTHFEGRLQRLRPGVPHRGSTRMGWHVLLELSARLGDELGFQSLPEVFDAMASEVTMYRGLALDDIGGQGLRWQDRPDGSSAIAKGVGDTPPGHEREASLEERVPGGASPAPSSGGDSEILLGTYRHIWADEATERNPALQFLIPDQTLELSPNDAERLGVGHGEAVEVAQNGTSVNARVVVRERMRPGAGFMVAGTARDNANALANGGPVRVEVRRAGA